jgi:hypothetical protein
MANETVSPGSDVQHGHNVFKHPGFGADPVQNIRAPGRKKGTASLQAARYKRWLADQPTAHPEPQEVRLPPTVKGRYYYPKAMLTQAYFCRVGTGIWHKPTMHLSMLVNENFVSPIGKLLDQLEAEGHKVSGARAEWLAFRELAKGLEADVEVLSRQVMHFMRKSPVSAALLIEDGSE